jgi:hypothetical protein
MVLVATNKLLHFKFQAKVKVLRTVAQVLVYLEANILNFKLKLLSDNITYPINYISSICNVYTAKTFTL